jgi:hypothetical protein
MITYLFLNVIISLSVEAGQSKRDYFAVPLVPASMASCRRGLQVDLSAAALRLEL